MTPRQLLDGLRGRDVVLVVDGDRLVVDGPEEALTAAVEARLSRYKAALIDLLRAEAASARPEADLGRAGAPDRATAAREHPFVRAVLETLGGTIIAVQVPRGLSNEKPVDVTDHQAAEPKPVT